MTDWGDRSRCHQQRWKKLESFIDFANSFIQGEETVNTIDDIAVGCEASEYTAATGSGLYQWTLDLNGACVQGSDYSDEGVYVFYWKAGKKFPWKTMPINWKTRKLHPKFHPYFIPTSPNFQ